MVKKIVKGYSSCVIVSPPKNLMCSKDTNPNNKVVKLISLENATKDVANKIMEEYKIGKSFLKIDPKNRYFLGGLTKCILKNTDLPKKIQEDCNFAAKKSFNIFNINMKKGAPFLDVAKNLSEEGLLASMAHLLVGAKKAIKANKLLLDIKPQHIIYINDESKAAQKLGTNMIHPVLIDFGATFVINNKSEYKKFIKDFGARYHASWAPELMIAMFFHDKNAKIKIPKNWKKISSDKKKVVSAVKAIKAGKMFDVANDLKKYNNINVFKEYEELEDYGKKYMRYVNSNYKGAMDKMYCYEIGFAFGYFVRNYLKKNSDKSKKLMKYINHMVVEDYSKRSSIDQMLKHLYKELGVKNEKALETIPYKKLTKFQKISKYH